MREWKKGESMSQNEQEILWKDRKHHLWFPISFTKYYITGGRLHIKKGLLSTIHDETILYRITDITLKRTLAHRRAGKRYSRTKPSVSVEAQPPDETFFSWPGSTSFPEVLFGKSKPIYLFCAWNLLLL